VSSADGRVVAFELVGLDVYPVYRQLAERGVSVKCIKKPGKRSESGDGCLEVLRVGFPWWTDAEQVDEAVAILSDIVKDAMPHGADAAHIDAA
jgi:selenocysteine lyase/cysteine desulfurase